jgi:alanine racemase
MSPSWIEINLMHLKENIRSLRNAVPSRTEIIFVIKANAYGHGLVPVAQTAAEEGISHFAVAYLEEALTLREVLPDVNILVLGYVFPEQVETLIEKRIIPIVTDLDHGLALAESAGRLGKKLPVHLKVDTGMGRFGVQWHEVEDTLREVDELRALEWTGLCSHFAKVEPGEPQSAALQAQRFEEVRRLLPDQTFTHLSSSRAALYFPEWDFDAIRQGIVLYGYGAQDPNGRFQTRPILQWKARVAQVKAVPAGFPVGYYGTYRTEHSTQLATLAVGYADGYNRALSNRGDVLIGGKRCAVVGRVSMNWITVDVGPDAEVQVGDEAVLIGEQGGESIWADELSSICRTIPYEILTSLNSSLKRVYTD